MATKSALISAVNGFITAIQSIANHRLSMLQLINELFQTTTTQTLITGTNVFHYDLRYKKVGNIIYIDGWIKNKFATLKSATILVTIPNSVYYAKTGQETTVFATATDVGFGSKIQLSMATSSIYLVGGLASEQRIYINAHYQTND